MNKSFIFLSFVSLFLLGACGGKGSSKANDAEQTEASEYSVTSDPSNATQEYSRYVEFSSKPAEVNVSGKKLVINVYPKIKEAAQMINDNSNTELVLIDEAGNELITISQLGRYRNFEDALYEGDQNFDKEFEFSKYFDSEEAAQEVADNARKFKINMAFKEKPVNKYPDWKPEGTYDLKDNGGTKFQLVLKSGGKAELINHNYAGEEGYSPSEGSWSQNDEVGYVDLDFFGGPFISIGNHSYFSSPVLTPDSIYYNRTSYEDGKDRLSVKKVE